jgi:hypothetical protein
VKERYEGRHEPRAPDEKRALLVRRQSRMPKFVVFKLRPIRCLYFLLYGVRPVAGVTSQDVFPRFGEARPFPAGWPAKRLHLAGSASRPAARKALPRGASPAWQDGWQDGRQAQWMAEKPPDRHD